MLYILGIAAIVGVVLLALIYSEVAAIRAVQEPAMQPVTPLRESKGWLTVYVGVILAGVLAATWLVYLR